MNNTTHVPAKLIIGQRNDCHRHILQIAQRLFCKAEQQTDSCYCTECKKIIQQQHHAMVWICPERDYTVDDIAIIFDRIRFSLDKDQQFFFILDKADTLTPSTGNRLLKVMEQPPAGYNFVLITDNPDAIMATIKSRCMIVDLYNKKNSYASLYDSLINHPITSVFFNEQKRRDPYSFEQNLKKLHLSDTASTQLIDDLLAYVSNELKKAHATNNNDACEQLGSLINQIKQIMQRPPQSGSSELFWKYLFLTLPHIPR